MVTIDSSANPLSCTERMSTMRGVIGAVARMSSPLADGSKDTMVAAMTHVSTGAAAAV